MKNPLALIWMSLLLVVGAVATMGAGTIVVSAGPTVVQTCSGTTASGTSVSISGCAAPRTGDLLLFAGCAYDGNEGGTLTPPSGFSAPDNLPNNATVVSPSTASSTGALMRSAYRIAQAGDTASWSMSYSSGKGATALIGQMVEYSGVSTSTPFYYAAQGSVTSTSSPTTPGLNGLTTNAVLPVTHFCADLTATTHSPAKNYIEDAFASTTNLSLQTQRARALITNTNTEQGGVTLNAAANDVVSEMLFVNPVGFVANVQPSPGCCTSGVEWPATFEPYAASSVWNKPMSNTTNPILWPNSDTIVQHAMTSSMGQQLWATDINLSNTCSGTCAADPEHPIFFAVSSDPVITVNCTTFCGLAPATMRIPAKARPGNIGGDSHIAVVQPDGTEIDTWSTHYPAGDWGTSGNTTITAQTVNTCGNFYTGPGFTGTALSSTVGDACLGGGMIREAEAVADAVGDSGTIHHALFLTVQCGTRNSGDFVYPAQQVFDNACGDGVSSFFNGAHLWSDYSDAQVDALYPGPTNSNAAINRAILKALHHYGGYILDSGGGAQTAQQPNVFFEDSGQFTAINGNNSSPFSVFGSANGWGHNTGGGFGTANYWTFADPWNPLSSAGGWPAHLHWVDPCYAQGTC